MTEELNKFWFLSLTHDVQPARKTRIWGDMATRTTISANGVLRMIYCSQVNCDWLTLTILVAVRCIRIKKIASNSHCEQMLSLQNFARVFLRCQNILFFNINWIQNIVRKGCAFLIWGSQVRILSGAPDKSRSIRPISIAWSCSVTKLEGELLETRALTPLTQ